MLDFLIRRLLQSVLVLVAMSVLVFIGIYAIGNPIDILLSPDADQMERARIIAAFGLDRPLWQQYFLFIQNALAGDLGRSFAFGTPALDLILERFPATMELAVSAILIAIVLGIPLGLLAGLYPRGWIGRSIMTVSILGFSLPTFWVGLMLILIFGVQLGWLPASGRGETVAVFGVPLSFLTVDGLKHLLLPAFNLALFNIALVIRLVRAGAQEALLQDYVRFARAKGLSNTRIIGVHVLKNILIPVVTVIALQFGSIIAFAIVTETVFAWPGMGKLIIDSIRVLDRPVIVAYLMLIVVLFVFINLIVDVVYSLLDPRVRLSDAEGARG
ncbi:MAG: ABC transporter permease [Oxalicibacterium faecigallinarum]|uniref:ABC transporter permease n=1 Tax=Oxalicibacterium faecigallinarum TaxID=573741 RepID=UPI002807AC18|nr:ABC transporter permease [Oxalicibacterium faecigallinarum]MDQ7968872.1 ABC transporter permease [Oxalicibacterium faecigallinarum]